MSEGGDQRAGTGADDLVPPGGPPAPTDREAALARRMFLRAGLIAAPAALATFAVECPARAQATCQPHWCSPGEPCNPVLCGPQICNPSN